MSRFKIIILHIFSVVSSVAPVLVFFFCNLDKYTKTQVETVKLTAGGIVLFAIVILKVIGKLRIPSGIKLYGIILILAYLLDAILKDLIVFAFLALLGEVLSSFCGLVIKAQVKRLEREKTASVTAEEIKKIIQGANGRV